MKGRIGITAFALCTLAPGANGCNKSGLVAGVEATPTPGPTPMPTFEPPEYLGREFFAVDLDNIYEPPSPLSPGVDAAGAQFAVVVSNPSPSAAAAVTVSSKTAQVASVSIAPGGLEVFQLPRADVDGTTVVPNAYRIASDIPVTAHQFNPLGNVLVYSNDASLLLPVNGLGKEYRVMAWPQTNAVKLPGFLAVAAVEPGQTSVTITVNGATKAGGGIPALSVGQTYTHVLEQFDVLALETSAQNEDLTGSLVVGDKNIAVFGGAECAFVPSNVSACDHLEEQMIPIQSWGKTYVAAKSKPRGSEPDLWRVMAKIDGTTITTNPLQPGTPVTLNAGQFVQFETTQSFVIVAGAPVQVGQYLVGQDYGGGFSTGFTGDPGFMVGVPVEQYRDEYIFLTPPNYANDSITIVAPTGTTVTLDGNAVNGFTETTSGSGWSVATLTVGDGVHKLQASAPVGLTVTGYDQYVSYGYPGGMNLGALTP